MASALLHEAAWRVGLHEACYDGHKQHATRYQDWLGKLNACFQTTFCEASVCSTKLPEHRQRGCIEACLCCSQVYCEGECTSRITVASTAGEEL